MLRDSFNYFLSKVIPGAMGLLSVTVFVRLVGYEEYGRYAVLFAMVMAFAFGMHGWLSQGVLRFQSKYSQGQQSFQRVIGVGTALSTAAGSVALGVFLVLSGHRSVAAVFVCIALFASTLVYAVVVARLQAFLRSGMVLGLESVRSVLAFLFPFILVWAFSRRDHRYLLFGILLSYLAVLAVCLFLRRTRADPQGKPGYQTLSPQEKVVLKEVWQYGWPVGLFFLCQQGLVISDRYFIQKSAGYSAAGIYASMYDVIVRSFSLIFMPISLAAQPLAMKHWNHGAKAHSLRVIRSAMRWQSYLFLPVAGLLLLFSSLLTRVVLGQRNAEAASMVLALAIGGFLWQLALLVHKPLELLCQTKRILGGMSTALLVNICGNYLFVPRFGFTASAYVMVASGLTYLIMLRLMTPAAVRTPAAHPEPAVRPLSQPTVPSTWSASPDA